MVECLAFGRPAESVSAPSSSQTPCAVREVHWGWSGAIKIALQIALELFRQVEIVGLSRQVAI